MAKKRKKWRREPAGRKVFGIRAEYKKPAKLKDEIVVRMAAGDGVFQVLLEGNDGELFSAVEFAAD